MQMHFHGEGQVVEARELRTDKGKGDVWRRVAKVAVLGLAVEVIVSDELWDTAKGAAASGSLMKVEGLFQPGLGGKTDLRLTALTSAAVRKGAA